MAIYTKTGDKGKTKVFDKKSGELIKISKSSRRVRTIGAIDELNSFLGMVGNLEEIQSDLFTINSIVAGSKLRFSKSKIKKLEKKIDEWEGSLPVLKNFIYYGGSKDASLIFYARALCRSAERNLVALSKLQATSYELLSYMNRLSDYFFMLARKVNFDEGYKEKVWKTTKNK